MKHGMPRKTAHHGLLDSARVGSQRRNAGGRYLAGFAVRAGRLVMLLALAASLVSCGSVAMVSTPTAFGPTPTVTVPVGMPVVISITGSFDDQTLATLDGQISAFEAANPDILVEVVKTRGEQQVWLESFVQALSQGDSSLDIYVVDYQWLPELAQPGWLRPLDDLLQAHGLDPATFLAPAAKASRLAGSCMALPWTADAGLLYYRRDQLDQPPATWPRLEQAALDVAPSAGLSYGYVWPAAAGDALTCSTLEFVWAFGGDVLDPLGGVSFDGPETRAALQQMVGLISSGASPQQVTTYSEDATVEVFQSGKALMMRSRAFAWERLSAAGSYLAGRVAVAPLPASCLGGRALALSEASIYPEQAFRFMAFLAAYEQQVQLARESSQLPALEAVYRDPALLAGDPSLAELHTGLLAARPRPMSEAYAALSEAIYSEAHLLLTGAQDVETTATRIQKRLERLIP